MRLASTVNGGLMADRMRDGAGTDGLAIGKDGRARCAWSAAAPIYRAYHDEEWGRPVTDDTRLFEKACLEGFQSGLSWLTILNKRENFRTAFAGFDIDAVAAFGSADVERLMGDAGIVRHRGKIEAAIGNAARARELRDEFGSLAAFVWAHEPGENERPAEPTWDWQRANTISEASTRLSRALRARGWRFVGPTTMHALMQAMGVVNDHVPGCHVRAACEAERDALERPEPSRPLTR